MVIIIRYRRRLRGVDRLHTVRHHALPMRGEPSPGADSGAAHLVSVGDWSPFAEMIGAVMMSCRVSGTKRRPMLSATPSGAHTSKTACGVRRGRRKQRVRTYSAHGESFECFGKFPGLAYSDRACIA